MNWVIKIFALVDLIENHQHLNRSLWGNGIINYRDLNLFNFII